MGKEPTNEKMTINGIDIFRLDNGVVVEHWDAARQMIVSGSRAER
jgi:predicted SnoaL-like aldol condensation-catalyzing enzyme